MRVVPAGMTSCALLALLLLLFNTQKWWLGTCCPKAPLPLPALSAGRTGASGAAAAAAAAHAAAAAAVARGVEAALGASAALTALRGLLHRSWMALSLQNPASELDPAFMVPRGGTSTPPTLDGCACCASGMDGICEHTEAAARRRRWTTTCAVGLTTLLKGHRLPAHPGRLSQHRRTGGLPGPVVREQSSNV